MKNGLYIVATPIGNLNDISIRAIETLKCAEFIICENQKHSIKLLSKLGIKKKLIPLHDHNEDKVIKKVEKNLINQIIVLISDAGSPLISDPGYKLVKFCEENNVYFTTIPGPSSLIAALQISTIPINKFKFLGFAPKTKKGLVDYLAEVQKSCITCVFFVSSHRVLSCLKEMLVIFGNRKIAVCKEITKLNEKKFIGLTKDVINKINKDSKNFLGEFVIIVQGNKEYLAERTVIGADIEKIISKLLNKFSLTDVVEIVHKFGYIGKKEIYKKALELKND